MRARNLLAAAALMAMVSLPFGNAGAFDETKYPNWKGLWMRADTGAPRYDPSKPSGKGQEAPLKPEFQAFLEALAKTKEYPLRRPPRDRKTS